jgi:L-fuconolactonase
MNTSKYASVHERWAHLRFSVIGQLLAAPPPKGELRAEIDKLAARTWQHPVTGEPVRFAASSIERWLLRAEVARTLAALPRLGLRFDALVKPRELPALLETLARLPELAVVVDHGAKPDIAASAWEPWAGMIAEVAKHPRARCKLSGLVTEAGPAWTIDTLRRYVDHLLTCFGPLRLMWGSDWPVVELGGGYRRWLAATVALLAPLAAADRAAVLGGTAQRFYGLE